ncbi:hypothetical protein BCR37DRAFT_104087 [Protomyces lactucae-debilis]|uniref:Uncharacterized protein n=1 Tax=Protomyces lactucae-debilis TaxID=2754530 RepID=A0A1Y2F6X6_PROLT|nr:uncharacterized protein BCR37DRAFT_104087 [Protomyces lactucae-debilis]ORY79086.1 hypothetical protein BCR37DRAFT_104087 [Protomyces lactucae-debilis]
MNCHDRTSRAPCHPLDVRHSLHQYHGNHQGHHKCPRHHHKPYAVPQCSDLRLFAAHPVLLLPGKVVVCATRVQPRETGRKGSSPTYTCSMISSSISYRSIVSPSWLLHSFAEAVSTY